MITMAALLCARPRAPANPAVVNVTDEADEIEAAAVDEAERAPAVATSERGLPSGNRGAIVVWCSVERPRALARVSRPLH